MEDAACQREYDILEIEYSALVKEYNAYKTQAKSFDAHCLSTYNNVVKPTKIEAKHCTKLKADIKLMNIEVINAVATAFDACIYKNKNSYINGRNTCSDCDTLVKRVQKHAGDSTTINSYFSRYAYGRCKLYRHPHGHGIDDPCS